MRSSRILLIYRFDQDLSAHEEEEEDENRLVSSNVGVILATRMTCSLMAGGGGEKDKIY